MKTKVKKKQEGKGQATNGRHSMSNGERTFCILIINSK